MPSPTEITVAQLSRLVGLPNAPALVDVRSDEEFQTDPRIVPTSRRQDSSDPAIWWKRYAGQSVIVLCQQGRASSQTVAAWLRHHGLDAQTLEGGFEAWCAGRHPVLRTQRLPQRDSEGHTVWMTRARPKVVRIACPWLIRRFIDPGAVFLFVPPPDVAGVARHANATPFDVEDVFWSDRGANTTFDVMLEEFAIGSEPLARLATIVRGADTGQPDLARQSAGLLALCLGYSRMHRDDMAQLDAAMPMFDALYRWSRDAFDERHG